MSCLSQIQVSTPFASLGCRFTIRHCPKPVIPIQPWTLFTNPFKPLWVKLFQVQWDPKLKNKELLLLRKRQWRRQKAQWGSDGSLRGYSRTDMISDWRWFTCLATAPWSCRLSRWTATLPQSVQATRSAGSNPTGQARWDFDPSIFFLKSFSNIFLNYSNRLSFGILKEGDSNTL